MEYLEEARAEVVFGIVILELVEASPGHQASLALALILCIWLGRGFGSDFPGV